MALDPLRDLCPRARVVWRNDAARCSVCELAVTRPSTGHAWHHLKSDLAAYIDEALVAGMVANLDHLLEEFHRTPRRPWHPATDNPTDT